MKKRRKLSPTVALLYLWTALFVIIPLVYVVVLSFMTRGESWGVTNEFTLSNYKQLFSPAVLKVFRDSISIAIQTTLLCFAVGYPFAYCTARMPKKYRNIIVFFLMAPFWINSLVRLYGWISILSANGVVNSTLLSLGLISQPLKLLYNQGAVIFGMVYALLPIMILSIYNSVEKMDWALVEAARDLGASKIRAFFTVTLPQTLPGVIAGAVLVFVPSVGLFFISDLLGGAKSLLVGNLIKNEIFTARNLPVGAALSVVLLVVSSVFILIYRRASNKNSLEDLV